MARAVGALYGVAVVVAATLPKRLYSTSACGPSGAGGGTGEHEVTLLLY